MRRLLLALALCFAPAAAFAQASPSPYTSATRYDGDGRVTGTISADPDTVGSGNPFLAVRNTYDGAGRVTKVETGTLSAWQSEAAAPASWGAAFTIARTLETQYDSVGHKIRDTLREGAAGTIRTITQYSYDSVGRLECTAVRMNPAVFGSLPSSACALGTEGSDGPDRITRNVYDAAGQRVQLREGVLTGWEAAEATWAYDNDGQVTSVIDANGNRASLTYDGFERQISWVFPVASGTGVANPATYDFSTQASALATAGSVNASDHEDYGYDLNGNRASLRKRDGSSLSYSYDALNRMTVKDAPGTAADVAYTYDLRNLQLTALFSATSQGVTNSYDGFGRLASSSSNMGGTARAVAYQYDRDSGRTRVTWPSGFYATYQFDGLDRLTLIQDQGTTTLASFAYDAPGRAVSRSDGTGGAAGSASVTYDGISRVATLTHDLASTPSDVTYTYTRNSASQLGSVARSNDAYAWAGLYTVTRNYTPNGLNQYGSIATVGGSTLTLTYDANGNLTSDGAGGNTYTYDTENRMVSVSGAHAATLAYDPLGRLWQVTNTTTGAVTQFVYDGDALIAEYNGSSTLLRRYVHGTNAAADDPMVWYEGSTVQYLHADHQGSIVAVAGSGGASVATDTYDEYGIPGAANAGRFQYTGQAWLSELGLYYYKARMYSPTLGRFMQTDPVGYDDQFNLYEYVGDDPVNRADPSGKYTTPDDQSNRTAGDDEGIVSRVSQRLSDASERFHAAAGRLYDAAGRLHAAAGRLQAAAGRMLDRARNMVTGSSRPNGVPDHWQSGPTRSGGGTTYVDPANPHNRVRDMPGNPQSPNPGQQHPYVKENVQGQPIDRLGRPVTSNSPESHIPRDQYHFRGKVEND